ncbi:MAG: dihydropyrimidinase, partial [Chloroflexi bacterium HGW-Chloroflexi-1]
TDAELDRWMADLLADGVTSVKVYTTYRPNYYQDDAALLRVFAAAARHAVIVMVHCENDAIVSAATTALIAAGQTGLANQGRARPALAEVEAAHRVLFLANTVGATVYVAHCSVSGTVDQVTQAVACSQRAIAETTPQYLLLDETVYAEEHPEWNIMQPPLREVSEAGRLWSQLASGMIATIGTDHCDYTIDQKCLSPHFHKTAGGIPGLETMLPLLATHGVDQGRISWPRLVEVCCANPARIFGLKGKGALVPGYAADVVIYDPRGETTIRAKALHNLAGYTPYEGWQVQGAVRDVFSHGRAVVRDGEFVPAPGWGRFVRAGRMVRAKD